MKFVFSAFLLFGLQLGFSQTNDIPGPITVWEWGLNLLHYVPAQQSLISIGQEIEINGKHFNEIILRSWVGQSLVDTSVIGVVRKEGSRIYVSREANGQLDEEYLQYDFSLMAGDTMLGGAPFFDGEVVYRISDRDTINCNGLILTRWMVSFDVEEHPQWPWVSSYKTWWVESIGDIYHPFIALDCYGGICETEYYEQSYRLSTGEVITLSDLLECDVVSNTFSVPHRSDISIYPNPISLSSQPTLRIDLGGLKITSVQLINPLGQIQHKKVYSSDVRSQSMEFDLSGPNLQPSVYFLVLNDDQGRSEVRKLVVGK